MRWLIRSYVAGALDVVERRALFSPRLDWADVRREALAVVAGAKQYSDTHDFLGDVLVRAGGRHSGLVRPGPGPRRSRLTPEQREALGPPHPTGHVIEHANVGVGPGVGGPIAYLRIPRTAHLHSDLAKTSAVRDARYVAAGAEVVSTLLATEPRGWIVDLRANVGGNMWPMLAVAGPLLPSGVLGYFEGRSGDFRPFGVNAGIAMLNGRKMAQLDSFGLLARRAQTPIAVLVSGHTASSGEAIALAFRAQPRARLFGTPTYGLTTANFPHVLRDRAVLRITTSYYADHRKVRCEGPIPVDQDLGGQSRSAVLDAACRWIASAS